jgi:hypothetical protein
VAPAEDPVHGPPPTPAANSKINDISMEKSLRASLTVNQKPCRGRDIPGILVVAIAVEITINSYKFVYGSR